MRNWIKALAVPALAATTSVALAQDTTTTDLGSLFGGTSLVTLVIVGVLLFLGFRFFFGGSGD